ncbi:hypothetical protein ACJRO7_001084 [Eucalyptus globulus]|uniref:NAC domain-containing protein n=1 Tax=Eucalyptus globulus TaxID=34317 RepID=A0ABD3LVI6_EUCGL
METPERRESCGCGCERPMPHASSAKRPPPGMAFYPHDHELIRLLHRKLSGQPLPPLLPLMDLNVYKHTPQQLSAKDADYDDDGDNPNRTKSENDMQLDGYVICKIHLNRRKSESDKRKEEGSETGQKKRKSVALTEGGRKAPHKDPDNLDFCTESMSPVPGPNDGTPLAPLGQAPIAKLPSVCGGIPVPDQRQQQQPQAAKEGTTCFEHADDPDDTVVNAMPLDMFDLWETQEQQQQAANHGAVNYSHPEVPIDSGAWPPRMPFISSAPGQPQTVTDPAVAVNFNPANNVSDDSISNGANAVGGLSLDCLDSSAFPADFGDDLLDNESSLLRYFDYNEFEVTLDTNCNKDCTGHENYTRPRNF